MAITRSQQARQMYRTAGAVQAAYGAAAAEKGPVEDKGNLQQDINQINQSVGNIENIQKAFDTAADINYLKNIMQGSGAKGVLSSIGAPLIIGNILKKISQSNRNKGMTIDDSEEESFADGGNVVGGEFDFESARQMYGLGKLVKKATRTVKKIAKSPVGKAALLYTGLGGLGSIAGGGTFFGNFMSPMSQLKGIGSIFSKTGLQNIGSKIGLGSFENVGANRIFQKNPLGEALLSAKGLITATSLLPLLGIGTGDESEEEAQALLDQSGIDIEAIRANPENFLAQRFRAEEGGRADESPKEGEKGIMKVASNDANERLLEQLFEQFLDEGFSPEEAAKKAREAFYDRDFAGAKGGDVEPVAKKTMPLLDMGGQEMDFRAEGGFVPIGRMEKADDVPARLSKNEFVFTADAVRNAGEGDIDKGAEVMYNMMKNLEAGGEVSEESQGLEGARKMFQTSKRLEEVL